MVMVTRQNYLTSINLFHTVFFQQRMNGSLVAHCYATGRKVLHLSINENRIKENLANVNKFRSLGSDELYPRILKELVRMIAEIFLLISENSWEEW